MSYCRKRHYITLHTKVCLKYETRKPSLDMHLPKRKCNFSRLVGWLEFNVPFQDKYGYIRGRNHFSNISSSCDSEIWPMTLTFELNLNIIKTNKPAKHHLIQKLSYEHRHTPHQLLYLDHKMVCKNTTLVSWWLCLFHNNYHVLLWCWFAQKVHSYIRHRTNFTRYFLSIFRCWVYRLL